MPITIAGTARPCHDAMQCMMPEYPYAAGTAILSKIQPLSVDYTLPGHPDASAVKGRIVTLEFESCYLIGTYVVNAGTGLKVRTPASTGLNAVQHRRPQEPAV